MKQFEKILAILLTLVMILSCIGTAAAADHADLISRRIRSDAPDRGNSAKGYKSGSFLRMNTYQYADNETVRTVVVLEGTPEAEIAERNSTRAISQRAKLMNEHQKVYGAMRGIDYTLLCEYTALLDGFACDVAYGDLDKIAAIEGVKAVHIANHFAAPAVEIAKEVRMGYAGSLTGNTVFGQNGCNGSGMVVAVLDTGLRTTHEAFRVYEGTDLVETLKASDVSKADAEGKYVSAKIPFAYDYADGDNDVADADGHGTHVAGIIGGLVIDSDGAVSFRGGAPMAQILAMKVFPDAVNSTDSTIYFHALEDAYKLGADVINMSLGSQNGFTFDAELEGEVFGNMYRNLRDAGIITCIASGNEGSMADHVKSEYIGPDYMDYGTIGSPASFEGNESIASVENLVYPSYVIEIGEEKGQIVYEDSSKNSLWRSTFGGMTDLPYVVVYSAEDPESISFGNAEDFEAASVSGKIAVVRRGVLDFQTKIKNAANAGAVGCIIINNETGTISMAIDTYDIPAVCVGQDATETFVRGNTLTVPKVMFDINNPLACQMSKFSAWGPTPDLTIDPAITSVGGKVYSSVSTDDQAYAVYNGTSMACPNAAATFANVLQALKEKGISDKVERAELARDLLESSAVIYADPEARYYSVRKQGAGLANSYLAAELYSNAAYITNPLQELGDDKEKTGEYSFEIELKNDTAKDVLYLYDGITITDQIDEVSLNDGESTLADLLTSYRLNAETKIHDAGFVTCYCKKFSDCNDKWYHEYVDYVCYAGLMNGTASDQFEPNGSMTRAMAVTVLYRMAGSPENCGISTFADVKSGSWYADAVAWAQAENVVNGTSATTFSPDAKITREQLATILWRYYDEADVDVSCLRDFTDGAGVSDYAEKAMAWAVENGILNGADGKLMPKNNATRAQYAAIITRILDGCYDCTNGYAITIPAKSVKKVTVTVTLTDSDKEYLDANFPNGAYVEGYVEFSNTDCCAHATYLAFYGDWTQAPVLEEADFRDLLNADIFVHTEAADESGNTYADLGYTSHDMLDYYTSPNMAYSAITDNGVSNDLVGILGDNLYDYVEFYDEHVCFSTDASDADNVLANGICMKPYQLRNCRHLIMTITDAKTGEVYCVNDTQYLAKARYSAKNGWMTSGDFCWDGKNKNGEYVPSGTIANVSFDAILPYGDTEVKNVWSYDVLVDYTAPVIDKVDFDRDAMTLTVTAHDENYLQAIVLYADDGSELDSCAFSSDKAGESFTVTFDLSEVVEEGIENVCVSAMDYATNETISDRVQTYEVLHSIFR